MLRRKMMCGQRTSSKKQKQGPWVFGTLMYAEEGEATETKAFKKAQAQEEAVLNETKKKHSSCLSVHRTVRLYVGPNRRRRWARRKYSIARVARGCTERSQEGFLPGISIQWVRRRDGRLPHLYPRGATERRLLNNVPRTLWMLKTLQRKQPGESRYLK